MNREETIRMLAVLKGVYPSTYKDFSKEELQGVVGIWNEMFADDSYETVMIAVKALIGSRTVGYPPTIGEVREQMYKTSQALKQDTGSAAEAWAKVSKAVHNGIYGYKKEFAKLPEDIQRVVGAPEQLRQWAMMDEETVETVIASNFQKAYRAEKRREKENAMLPTDIQAMINNALPATDKKLLN